MWKTAAPLALRFNLFINVNMKYDHVGMNRDDHLFLYNPKESNKLYLVNNPIIFLYLCALFWIVQLKTECARTF